VAGVVAAQPRLRELSGADRAAILDRIVAMLSEDVDSLADELADEARFLTRQRHGARSPAHDRRPAR